MTSEAVLTSLRVQEGDLILYKAGLPTNPDKEGYTQNFTRDGIISALLLSYPRMLRDQLIYCARRQAVKKDPRTGAEPGRIHHQVPGVRINGHSTEYNGDDTTALFLIGFSGYYWMTKDSYLVNEYKPNIGKAADNIISHLDENGLYTVDPRFCGAERYGLKVTYWKDSYLFGREDGEPEYPAVFTLAHIQNMRGIRSAANLLHSTELRNISDVMQQATQRLYNLELGTFNIAIDKQGTIAGISSDSLQALFYLNPEDLDSHQYKAIIRSSEILETPFGYRALEPKMAEEMRDKYHATTIWPFENALIDIATTNMGSWFSQNHRRDLEPSFRHVSGTSRNAMRQMNGDYNEIFIINGDKIIKGGMNPQLWSYAAKMHYLRTTRQHSPITLQKYLVA